MISTWKEQPDEGFEVSKQFDVHIPVCSAYVSCYKENTTIGLEVTYTDFGFDETLADHVCTKRKVEDDGGGFKCVFDCPCNDFSLTLNADDRPREIVVELCMADLNSFVWVIHPRNTFDFLLRI